MTKWLAKDFCVKKRRIRDGETLTKELKNYSNERFPGLLKSLTKAEEDEFLLDITSVLLIKKRGHNHDYLPPKDDDCWSIIVNANTGFSADKVRLFFEKRGLAFLCMWFCFAVGEEPIKKEFAKKNLSEMFKITHKLGHSALDQLAEEPDKGLNMKLLKYVN